MEALLLLPRFTLARRVRHKNLWSAGIISTDGAREAGAAHVHLRGKGEPKIKICGGAALHADEVRRWVLLMAVRSSVLRRGGWDPRGLAGRISASLAALIIHSHH